MKTIALLLYLFYISTTLHATYGKEKTDSPPYNENSTQFRPYKLILPTSLILVGSWRGDM